MEKLSGLLLDLYDDPSGEVMREAFPSQASVPDFIKSAHYLKEEDRRDLPDDVFALVLRDGDVVLRKYACVDAGNTAASVEYFLRQGHKLPEEAQKTAARNLLVACEWYALSPPEELQKVAFGGSLLRLAGKGVVGAGRRAASSFAKNPVGTALKGFGLYQTAGAIKDTAGQVSQNLRDMRAGVLPSGQRALQGM